MQRVGIVRFVQIQRSNMKAIVDGESIYQPDPLLTVARLMLDRHGISGVSVSGETLTDVHNENHPQSRYRGDNKISFGFLHNYEAMRKRFGEHLVDGIAGENIILQADQTSARWLNNSRFFIKHQDDQPMTELTSVIPAPPCREFSTFCLQVPQCAEDIKATLQFLSNGVRGYYAELSNPDCQCYVCAGDELFVE